MPASRYADLITVKIIGTAALIIYPYYKTGIKTITDKFDIGLYAAVFHYTVFPNKFIALARIYCHPTFVRPPVSLQYFPIVKIC